MSCDDLDALEEATSWGTRIMGNCREAKKWGAYLRREHMLGIGVSNSFDDGGTIVLSSDGYNNSLKITLD